MPRGPLPRLAGKGPRTLEALLNELALTRQRGYSIDDEACAKVCIRSARRCSTPAASRWPAIAVCINKAHAGNDRGEPPRAAGCRSSRRPAQRLARRAPGARGRGGRRHDRPGGDYILETRGPDQGVQGLRRRQQRGPAGAPRRHPRADRPQRRRQDDLLQPADQVPDAHPGTIIFDGARHHATRSRRRSRAAASSARSRSRPCSRT